MKWHFGIKAEGKVFVVVWPQVVLHHTSNWNGFTISHGKSSCNGIRENGKETGGNACIHEFYESLILMLEDVYDWGQYFLCNAASGRMVANITDCMSS